MNAKRKAFKGKSLAFRFNGIEEQFATPSEGWLVFVLEFFLLGYASTAFIRFTTVHTRQSFYVLECSN